MDCQIHRRPSVIIFRVDIRAAFKQASSGGYVVFPRRLQQRIHLAFLFRRGGGCLRRRSGFWRGLRRLRVGGGEGVRVFRVRGAYMLRTGNADRNERGKASANAGDFSGGAGEWQGFAGLDADGFRQQASAKVGGVASGEVDRLRALVCDLSAFALHFYAGFAAFGKGGVLLGPSGGGQGENGKGDDFFHGFFLSCLAFSVFGQGDSTLFLSRSGVQPPAPRRRDSFNKRRKSLRILYKSASGG